MSNKSDEILLSVFRECSPDLLNLRRPEGVKFSISASVVERITMWARGRHPHEYDVAMNELDPGHAIQGEG